MPHRFHFKVASILIVCLLALSGAVRADTIDCAAIMQKAYKALDGACNTLTRNFMCYGHDAVRAEFDPELAQQPTFIKSGDNAPILAFRELYTLPMDITTGTWGLSLLKVQANLPDTAPGQNIVFMIFGDVHVTNGSGDMSAFYFTSGLGQTACKQPPPDGLIVRSPKGTRVQFTANGVKLNIGSTVVLRAVKAGKMHIALVEGSAYVTAKGATQILQPGQSTSVQLGGVTGLEPIGTPSAPVTTPRTISVPVDTIITNTALVLIPDTEHPGDGGMSGLGDGGSGGLSSGGQGKGGSGNSGQGSGGQASGTSGDKTKKPKDKDDKGGDKEKDKDKGGKDKK